MKLVITNLQDKIRINRKIIKDLIQNILLKENKPKAEISLLLVDDLKIKKLNKRFLGRNYPTDVIAFPMQKGKFSGINPNLLGDIVISTQTIIRNSEFYKTTVKNEFYLCLIHGILHLLGYQDNNKRNKSIMYNLQRYYLSNFKKIK